MTIPPDLEAQILRYYHVEKWRVGTIARQLHVHHGTVARVLAQAGLPRIGPPARRSQVEPYLPFIHQTLEKFPTLTASRLYAMVSERGYRGSPDHFRHLIACHRPRPAAEAYLRLRSLPGEQGQVDWGHFGHLVIGRARRPLLAFVMVLSYSRQIFLRFFLDARIQSPTFRGVLAKAACVILHNGSLLLFQFQLATGNSQPRSGSNPRGRTEPFVPLRILQRAPSEGLRNGGDQLWRHPKITGGMPPNVSGLLKRLTWLKGRRAASGNGRALAELG